MVHPNKRRGDRFEIAVREHCREAGFDADRTRAGYARDYGDIHLAATPAGPRLILQTKNVREPRWSEFVRETEEQREAAGAEHGAAVVKRRGVGDVGQSYVVQTLDEYLEMARRAGYAIEAEGSAR